MIGMPSFAARSRTAAPNGTPGLFTMQRQLGDFASASKPSLSVQIPTPRSRNRPSSAALQRGLPLSHARTDDDPNRSTRAWAAAMPATPSPTTRYGPGGAAGRPSGDWRVNRSVTFNMTACAQSVQRSGEQTPEPIPSRLAELPKRSLEHGNVRVGRGEVRAELLALRSQPACFQKGSRAAQVRLALTPHQVGEFVGRRTLERLRRTDALSKTQELDRVLPRLMMREHEVAVDLAHARLPMRKVTGQTRCVDCQLPVGQSGEPIGLHRRITIGCHPAIAAHHAIHVHRPTSRHALEHASAQRDHQVRVGDRVLRRCRSGRCRTGPRQPDLVRATRTLDQVRSRAPDVVTQN